MDKRVKNSINFLKQNNFMHRFNKAESSLEKWRVLKSTGCSREKKSIELSDDITLNNLNQHFINIHKSTFIPDSIGITQVDSPHLKFEFEILTHADIMAAIGQIKSTAVGADNVSIKFLKMIIKFFIDPILHIFNYSLEKSVFPHLWNLVRIRPIKKIPNPKTPSDTRPITVNSIFTKIFTSALNTQLKSFIDENDILSPYQSGFRNKHSCTTALIRVCEDIRWAIANNEITILVLLDIRSAYPSVSHGLLLHVLKSVGTQAVSLQWIKAFISNKRQFVEINSMQSDTADVDCGLMQGDNLSQTFFSLVINGVTKHIKHSRFHLYADDKSIYLHAGVDQLNDAIARINADVDIINKWLIQHGMELNPKKTQAIIIGSQQNLGRVKQSDIPKIQVQCTKVEYSPSVKYLGFSFNENFESSDHVDEIIRKVNFSLSKINHCRRSIPADAK